MILNKKQLSAAQKGIDVLIRKINTLNSSSEVFDVMQVHAWKCRIEDLTEEIEEFKQLENASELEFSKENLLEAIISLRVASGLTQKQLAEAIMVQEQQIQRYEQDYYRTASFERIVQILRALSQDIQLKIDLKKAKVIRMFPSVEQDPKVVQMMKIVQERQRLVVY
ncbi:MAG: helix-turn-helix domain-containing protein [Dysgonamonadaceae bacterium]|jgi:transcriptional regulator with XRE-family HTH domain|nr:helix-turn-helix domain-containing protein [Dysgonamonadaceae bacterium]